MEFAFDILLVEEGPADPRKMHGPDFQLPCSHCFGCVVQELVPRLGGDIRAGAHDSGGADYMQKSLRRYVRAAIYEHGLLDRAR